MSIDSRLQMSPEITATERLQSFDVEKYERRIVKKLPSHIRNDPAIANLAIKNEINNKVQKLVRAAMAEGREEIDQIW